MMTRTFKYVLAAVGIYVSWLVMMAVHELGHVIHAWGSGASVSNVELPALGFSRTDLANNPHPLFVAWGGAIWGVLIPLGAFGIARWWKLRFWYLLRFFGGFCAVANGAYMGAGSLIGAGDAGDLMRHGAPRWILILFGVLSLSLGLYLWHGLARYFAIVGEGGSQSEPQ